MTAADYLEAARRATSAPERRYLAGQSAGLTRMADQVAGLGRSRDQDAWRGWQG